MGERQVLCGAPSATTVRAPDGSVARLLPDDTVPRCAAYWPGVVGWHEVRAGERGVAFHVRGAYEVPGVRSRLRREATLQLAARPASTGNEAVGEIARAGARWPWFVAWLLVSALLWWCERRSVPAPRA